MIIVIMLPHSFRRDSVCSILEAKFIYFIYFRHLGVYKHRVDIFMACLQFSTQRMHVIHRAEQAQVLNMTPESEQLQSAESGGVYCGCGV